MASLIRPDHGPVLRPLETIMTNTTLEQLAGFAVRAQKATAEGGQAFARLLKLAEGSDTGQARRVAAFVASTYNGRRYPFDLFELRAVDAQIGDDMLLCLDALRWARADLYRLVPDGEMRVRAVIQDWGLRAWLRLRLQGQGRFCRLRGSPQSSTCFILAWDGEHQG
ncbi:MAG: DUF7673 family protein [Roseateles sp.]